MLHVSGHEIDSCKTQKCSLMGSHFPMEKSQSRNVWTHSLRSIQLLKHKLQSTENSLISKKGEKEATMGDIILNFWQCQSTLALFLRVAN